MEEADKDVKVFCFRYKFNNKICLDVVMHVTLRSTELPNVHESDTTAVDSSIGGY